MQTKQLASRFHDISCGHRVAGHENKCAMLHGHNYRIHFTCEGPLDTLGRVLDFSAINSKLCMWLENNWDHKFLAWKHDSLMKSIYKSTGFHRDDGPTVLKSIVWLPFNPTAENMAEYLLNTIGPRQLEGTDVKLIKVVVEETRKCSASAEL